MYTQVFDPVAHSIGASAAFAALPLLTLFVLLGVLRLPARRAALAALAVALAVAVLVYGMPGGQALAGALEGAAIGFFPIIWIGINAIWLFKLTQESGHANVLRRALAGVSTDQRVQAILIAFCFGALLEALAGGGAPVAICAVLLISLGVDPLKSAAICLLADTSPVAFGALGLPITVLAKITRLPVHEISVMVGRQAPLLSLLIPLMLVFIHDGRRGVREMWPLAAVAGVSFAFAQCAGSMLLPVELVDIVAALGCAGASILFLRVWSPACLRADLGATDATAPRHARAGLPGVHAAHAPGRAGAAPRGAALAMPMTGGGGFAHRAGAEVERAGRADAWPAAPRDSFAEVLRALAPYAVVILVVAATQIGAIAHAMGFFTSSFAWPGLHVVDPAGAPVAAVNARFEWLLSAGSIVLIAGALSVPLLRLDARMAARSYLRNLHELRWAVFTVCCVVGVAYVMNLSGQIVTLGIWAAKAGPAFAPVSPILGWFATALTGSDTSANALFGMLQLTTAHHTGLPAVLLAAANTSGGVVGKAISPQNLAVGAVAVGMIGREGLLFRRVAGWTLLMIAALSLLVWAQSTPLLGWMLP
ncbi:L-lactate permease [Burkholderia plantarii]|uniref:L-lactate permease n=1 Tax=Burkholderia plantarii TaxID=41899 RepID=UPI0018DE9DBB|nr:L-lactate permease [Burkholderia plantarii]MBI0329358.1 L-lactate permease [Burkholderia plantarii]